MIKIITISIITILLSVSLYGGDNFSEMSTQELISIIGYVKKNDLEKFKAELKLREKNMSDKEKKTYNENLKKIK